MAARTIRSFSNALTVLMLVNLGLASPASAQAEPDPAAAKAFEVMVKSMRDQPALVVRTKLKIVVSEGAVQSEPREVEAEFTYGRGGAGVLKLNDFTCYIKDNTFQAIHDSTSQHSYYSQSFDGSPYWVLLNVFRDIPFPHLGILWGDEPVEDVYMELHPATNEIVPTAVADGVLDGVNTRTITLSSETANMTINLEPSTNLIRSLELVLSGGQFVKPGAKVTNTYSFEYETFDKPLEDSVFELDRGQRQRVDVMAALIDVPPPAMPDPVQPGGAPAAPLVGKPAPEFTLATMTGDAIDLGDLRGQVVVLDFWATWCGPCVIGLPKLHEVAKWAVAESLPVNVIAVNTFQRGSPDQRLAAARDFWKQHKHSLPVAMDYSDETAAAYQVSGIPTTVIIRADGVVHAVHVGIPPGGPNALATQLKDEIRGAIEALQGSD